MISGMAAFGVAVGGTSLVCYLLMNRVQNRRARRGASNGSGLDGGGSIDDSLFGWSGGGSIDNHQFGWSGGSPATSDTSGSPSDFGSDSGGAGGGGDSVGGGD